MDIYIHRSNSDSSLICVPVESCVHVGSCSIMVKCMFLPPCISASSLDSKSVHYIVNFQHLVGMND